MDAVSGGPNETNQSDHLPLPSISEPLRSGLANSQVVLFRQDLHLRYTWIFNPHLGFIAEDVLGKHDEDLLPPDEARALTVIKQGVLDSGQATRETVRTTRNGVAAYYDLVVEPLRDATGAIVGISCASTDVTKHRQAAADLLFQTTVLETISEAVIAVDLSGRVLYWNSGAESLFGYTADEMLGQPPDRLFPPEDRALFPERFATVMDGSSQSGEWQAIDKQGVTRWIDMTARAIQDSDGIITGVVGIGKDITDRRHVEEEQRFHILVLESIHDSVIVTDLTGVVTYWNRGAEDAFGYRAEEMLGQHLAILYEGSDTEEVTADLASISEGDDFHGEWRGRSKDGTPIWVDIRTTALRDADGTCVGFVGVSKDITTRKHVERERDQLLERERASRRRLRQFLALVAHDLRSPVATIFGFAQLLARRSLAVDSDTYSQAVESIASSAMLMTRLASDLNDAAAAGEGLFTVQPARVELIGLIQEVVSECQAGTGNHQLRVSAPSALHGEWDAQRLHQLLDNLIANAIKYSPAGGEIVIAVRKAGSDVVIEVQDPGIGIDSEEQQGLFNLFARGEDVEDIDGFGLGLYICRAIVEAHGGHIEVDSEPGRGSKFTVKLPREKMAASSNDILSASS